jgi:hypothetical protein
LIFEIEEPNSLFDNHLPNHVKKKKKEDNHLPKDNQSYHVYQKKIINLKIKQITPHKTYFMIKKKKKLGESSHTLLKLPSN